MAHTQQIDFCKSVQSVFPKYFSNTFVIDIGSLDINGNNRYLFNDCFHLGVDIAFGKNVDLYLKGHELDLPDESVDVIISTECFEHDRFYELSLKNITRMLKPGGLFLFTCATVGRPEHGTRRTSPDDAPLIQDFDDWADYYKNLEEKDIRNAINVEEVFESFSFSVNNDSHDLYFWGIKKGIFQPYSASELQLPSPILISALKNRDDNFSILEKKIGEQDQAVAERDESIATLSHAITECDEFIIFLKQAIAERDESVVTLNHALAERDESIATLSHAITECDEFIVFLKQAIAERDESVAALNHALAERDESIATLSHAVAECDEFIAFLKQAIAERDEFIAFLKQGIAERDGAIASLNQVVAERDDLKQAVVVELDDLKQAIAERDEQNCSLNKAITEIRNSTSWKLSAPIRIIGKTVLRTKIVLKALFYAKAYLKTYRNILMLVKKTYDAEGVIGIKQRIIFLAENSQLINQVVAEHDESATVLNEAVCEDISVNSTPKSWGILTTQHTLFIACLIKNSLQQHNYQVDIFLEKKYSAFHHDMYIILCPQMFENLPPMEKIIAFQLEQSVSSRWFTESYLDMLNNSFAVLDYSLVNIDFLKEKGIAYPHVNYLPVGALKHYGEHLNIINEKKYDVLFYGDYLSSPRRQLMLDALKLHFSVHIASEVFGDEMLMLIKQSRCVINLHYYENALLEMPRIQECLSLGIPVVSESAQDQNDYPELSEAVQFFEQSSIPSMLVAVKSAIENPISTEAIKKSVDLSEKRFQFMFNRFLLSKNFIPVTFIDDIEIYMPISDKLPIVLSLPETIDRRHDFEKRNVELIDSVIFDGMRYSPGWIGCGLSYKALAKYAVSHGIKQLTVMEDDVVLPHDFKEKIAIVQEYLDSKNGEWDIFSGLVAVIHPDVQILSVEVFKGITFVTINKMISMVFNIYNEKTLNILKLWNPENPKVNYNTIDKFLECQKELKTVITIPFLVGHHEEVNSTLWGFNNSQYNDMIEESERLLASLIANRLAAK